jgi:hypothetical protein
MYLSSVRNVFPSMQQSAWLELDGIHSLASGRVNRYQEWGYSYLEQGTSS